jgi:hypothetical protein
VLPTTSNPKPTQATKIEDEGGLGKGRRVLKNWRHFFEKRSIVFFKTRLLFFACLFMATKTAAWNYRRS